MSYDLLPIFKELVDTKRERAAAELAIAIIEFDKDGVEPSFSDDNVNFTWIRISRGIKKHVRNEQKL